MAPLDGIAGALSRGSRTPSIVKVGSYILTSNIVEFNMPAYLGLYPSFLMHWSQSISSWLLLSIAGSFTSSFGYLITVLPEYQSAP